MRGVERNGGSSVPAHTWGQKMARTCPMMDSGRPMNKNKLSANECKEGVAYLQVLGILAIEN